MPFLQIIFIKSVFCSSFHDAIFNLASCGCYLSLSRTGRSLI